ncbi:hypothetical protein BDV40DRAFT_271821 [Aspergillus tamarii]|uniref:Uncharacterized protein n=1 Tax=Aspergillus tamarii TaxID=41984 RepID=A0A5N6UML9_ASPTM|nr:hypothetical protein BDV40DRAFT_271821 [Aspergillus tamarii]
MSLMLASMPYKHNLPHEVKVRLSHVFIFRTLFVFPQGTQRKHIAMQSLPTKVG